VCGRVGVHLSLSLPYPQVVPVCCCDLPCAQVHLRLLTTIRDQCKLMTREITNWVAQAAETPPGKLPVNVVSSLLAVYPPLVNLPDIDMLLLKVMNGGALPGAVLQVSWDPCPQKSLPCTAHLLYCAACRRVWLSGWWIEGRRGGGVGQWLPAADCVGGCLVGEGGGGVRTRGGPCGALEAICHRVGGLVWHLGEGLRSG
jgi:hypothetical protein